MNDLLLHPKVEEHLDLIIKDPPQALILSGNSGEEISKIATYVALSFFPENSIYSQNIFEIHPEKHDSYGVDIIDSVLHFINVKSVVSSTVNKIVIINSVEALSFPAQTQLLKPLEDCNAGILFILTTTNDTKILPTILSRCRQLNILSPTKDQVIKFFRALSYQQPEIEKAYQIGGGQLLIIKMLLENVDNPLIERVNSIKDLLVVDTFSKLRLIESKNYTKDDLAGLASMLQQVAHTALQNSNQNANRWLEIMTKANEAESLLKSNVSPKLVADKLILSL